ncbi:YbfB/YjiJ family MFS transporter [Ferrimicrobium acidiphilum]|uniref:YbfB/YjiJ family MFS transporter n=1 Tax=Ferrimicrobium acidiphilum TaxID=121039 RepID=UPI0023F3AB08|nr:YbfB/YjiJ family MFS transporter [Ferrimicrobium acidiphilum]
MPTDSARRRWRQLLPVGNSGTPSGLAVALRLALGSAVAIGLARFAYALLLPSMRADLHWSFATAGAMNTANALGYLVGALLTALAARRYGTRLVFVIGLGVTVLALFATGSTGSTVMLVALRAIAGASGAVTFIAGAGLVAASASTISPHRAARLLGIYFAGGGAAIIASGLGIPYLLAATSVADGWRWGWVLLAGLGAVAFAVATPVALASTEPPTPPVADRRWPARRLGPALLSYGLFGAGYIAYMTFIVAFLKAHGTGPGGITVFWVVLGAASIAGAFLWARPIARLHGGRGPATVLVVLGAGALLPLLSRSPEAVMGSALLFGGSFLSVVTAFTAVARRSLQPHYWTPAIAGLTVAFAVGQCLGPVLAGVLSDGPSGLSVGLSLSVVVLGAGAVVALTQRHHETTSHSVDVPTDPPTVV